MYRVLSSWQFQSNSRQCFGENNISMQEEGGTRVLKLSASFRNRAKSAVKMPSWTPILLQLQSSKCLILFDIGRKENKFLCVFFSVVFVM